MLRSQNRPQLHRSGNLLCGNLSGRAKSVNWSSLEYSLGSQHLQLSSVGERTSPTFPADVVPMMARDRYFYTDHPMNPMGPEYCVPPPPICTPNLPQFAGYYPVAEPRFDADAYGPFVPTSQPLGDPTSFGGMFYEPLAAQEQQPPIPPAAPEESIPPSLAFHYYPCRWLGGPRCDGLAPGRNREMGEHLRVYHHFIGHERDTVECEWENCGHTMQRMNVPRHIVSRHLLAAASCRFCRKRFSRPDVVARHERTCSGALPVETCSAIRI